MDKMLTVSFTDYEALKQENDKLKKLLAINLSLKGPLRRQYWITERLRQHGFINRADITHTFGVTLVQASIDLRNWMKHNPKRIDYNKSSKRYEEIR